MSDDCAHLNIEEFTDESIRCEDCCRMWFEATKAMADANVAAKAIALVRSGYDGSFMGDAVAPLFEAVAMHERAVPRRSPGEGETP